MRAVRWIDMSLVIPHTEKVKKPTEIGELDQI